MASISLVINEHRERGLISCPHLTWNMNWDPRRESYDTVFSSFLLGCKTPWLGIVITNLPPAIGRLLMPARAHEDTQPTLGHLEVAEEILDLALVLRGLLHFWALPAAQASNAFQEEAPQRELFLIEHVTALLESTLSPCVYCVMWYSLSGGKKRKHRYLTVL